MNDTESPDFVDSLVFYRMGFYPICAAVYESLRIPHIIDEAVGPLDPRAKLSIGTIVKAFVLDMLNNRTPLYRMNESFVELDCEVLFGPGVCPGDFTEDRLGTALDIIAELDTRQLFSSIALFALKTYDVPVNSIHIDTTNFSLFGDYNGPAADNFDVNFGHPKNKRTDLRQITLGAGVQQNNLPVLGQGLSGNTSDAIWFREAMDEVVDLFKGDLHTNPILIYDAAASNNNMFTQANDRKAPCITRLSERFKITNQHIQKAWEENRWQEVGPLAQQTKKHSAVYRITTFHVEFDAKPWRLLVIHSSALEQAKAATAARQLPKKKQQLEKETHTLTKKAFPSEEEAMRAAEQFAKDHVADKTVFDYQTTVETRITEKYPRPGKPDKDAKRVTITTYHAIVSIGDINPQRYEQWLQQESCFVLVDNVPPERCEDVQILKEYKSQWQIEHQFRFLKQPLVLQPIWLHHKTRIKALTFLLLLAMLVAAYVRHRLHVSLTKGTPTTESGSPCYPEQSQPVANTNKGATDDKVLHTETRDTALTHSSSSETAVITSSDQVALVQAADVTTAEGSPIAKVVPDGQTHLALNTEVNTSSQQIVPPKQICRLRTKHGRLVNNPTFNVAKGEFSNVITFTIWDPINNRRVRCFPKQSRDYIYQLIRDIGFDPAIYLKPFHPAFDLWRYRLRI